MSIPGSPSRSSAPSRQTSRPSSPTRMGASKRKAPGPLLMNVSVSAITKDKSRDPLRRFPTEVSQRVFRELPIKDLAKCARVCRKWAKSQTINYGELFLTLPLIHAILIRLASLVPALSER